MDLLLSSQLLVAALVLASVYALVAIGLNLVYGTMRLLNVAHGELVMLGGYVTYWAFMGLGINPLAGALIAMSLGAVAGILLYATLVRGLVRSSRVLARLEANSMLLFFGLSVILQNLTALAFTTNNRSYSFLDDFLVIGDLRTV